MHHVVPDNPINLSFPTPFSGPLPVPIRLTIHLTLGSLRVLKERGREGVCEYLVVHSQRRDLELFRLLLIQGYDWGFSVPGTRQRGATDNRLRSPYDDLQIVD